MTLFQIIKSIQDAQGSKAKQAILDENKDNLLLKDFLRATYDPAVSYYQSKLPKISAVGTLEFNEKDIEEVGRYLAQRTLTGNAAKDWLKKVAESLNVEGQELISMLIKRTIGASVGETMVLNTFPNLFFIPPYQRCSLMDTKIKKKFDALEYFFIQTKMDGSFAYSVNNGVQEQLITRQGNLYPDWFAHLIGTDNPDNTVIIGEMLVYENGDLLDRKTGNGILNSIQQGAEQSEVSQYEFRHIAWDQLTLDEFKKGESKRTVEERFNELVSTRNPELVVEHEIVHSLDAAFKINTRKTRAGKEGSVIKNPSALWKDGTSKDEIKLKVKFTADYRITGYYEGEGNAAGTMGGLNIESLEGKVKSNVGVITGKGMREKLWAIRETLVDMIAEVEANDIVTSRDKDTVSLNLPVLIEVRPKSDKKEADSYERVLAQLESAKFGG